MIKNKRYKNRIKRYFLGYVTGGLQEKPAASDSEKRSQKSIHNGAWETRPAAAGGAQ
jgi:hypothetical protein